MTVSVPNSTTTKTITSNGTYTPESPNIGYSSVTVSVPNQTTTRTFTSNGTFSPTLPYIGYSSVKVDVQPNLDKRTVLYSSNGTYRIEPSSGYEGLSYVDVTVDTPVYNIQNEKRVEFTTNGSSLVTPDSGYDYLSSVRVVRNISADVEQRNVSYTKNGSYTITPSSGKVGISRVNLTLNIPGVITGYRYRINNGSWIHEKTINKDISPYECTSDNTLLLFYDDYYYCFTVVELSNGDTWTGYSENTSSPLISSTSGQNVYVEFKDDFGNTVTTLSYSSIIDVGIDQNYRYNIGGCLSSNLSIYKFKIYYSNPLTVGSMLEKDIYPSDLVPGEVIYNNEKRLYIIYDSSIKKFYNKSIGTYQRYECSLTEYVLFSFKQSTYFWYYFGIQDNYKRYMYNEFVKTTSWYYYLPSRMNLTLNN